jgi:hypothetical protein
MLGNEIGQGNIALDISRTVSLILYVPPSSYSHQTSMQLLRCLRRKAVMQLTICVGSSLPCRSLYWVVISTMLLTITSNHSNKYFILYVKIGGSNLDDRFLVRLSCRSAGDRLSSCSTAGDSGTESMLVVLAALL